MLKLLRKKGVMKKLLWAVAILIIISFGLMGKASYLSQRNPDNIAGVIFGKKIDMDKFIKAYNDTRLQALIRYGDNFDNVKGCRDLTSETWDRLILLHVAKKQKIKVTNSEVINAIEQYPFFQQNNIFDNNLYQQILQYGFRVQPREFEESIRDLLKITKLYNKQVSRLNITDETIFNEYRKVNEKRQVSYTFFATDTYKTEASVDHEEIRSYYDENPEEFTVPPNIKLAYISIPIIDNQKDESTNEEKNENKNNKNPSPSGRDIALSQAETIYDELYLNSHLEKIAEKNKLTVFNTDFMSMEKPDLSLGWPYNKLIEIFEYETGQISMPFETEKAFFIVQMKQKREAYIPLFKEAQEKAAETVLLKKAKKIAEQNALKNLLTIHDELSKTKAPNFPKTVKNLGFDVGQTPQFSRGQYLPTIGISKNFQEAAFALNEKNKLSDVIETEKNYCILYLDEIVPVDEKIYHKEKDTFTQNLLNEIRNKHFSDFLIQLRTNAKIKDVVSEKTK